MPVDTSMYNTTPPAPANPLAMMSQMQGIQGQMLRNQLMQKTMASQQAIGQAAQASLRPDGTTDLAMYQQGVQGDPNAAFGAQDAANNAQQQATSQQALQQAQLEFHMKRLGAVQQMLGSLADKPNATTADVQALGTEISQNQLMPPDAIATELASAPSDPTKINAWARSKQLQASTAVQQISLMHQQNYVNTGNNDVLTNTAPLATPGAPGTPQSLTNTPAPGMTNTTDPKTGQTTAVRTIDAYNTPGGVTTGQPTELQHQQASAGGAAGQLGAQREVAIQGEMPQLMANRAAFRGLTADINNGMFNGNGAEAGLAVSKWAQAAGFKVDTTKIANTEDAVKAVARIVANIPGATHSDQLNAQAIAQNPTISKSPEGFARLTAMAQGYNDARLATVNGIRDFRNNNPHYAASNIPNLEGAITKLNSVPMFQYNALPDQYKHTMTDNMPGATTFINNYNKAKALGLFSKGLGE